MKYTVYYKEIRLRTIEISAEDEQDAWKKGVAMYRNRETGIELNNYTLALMSIDDENFDDIAEYEVGRGEYE